MKKLVVVLFALVFASVLYADVFSNPFTGDTASLPGLSSNGSPVVSAYTQTKTISRLNRKLVSSGTFILKPESGMVWATVKPYESVLFVGRSEAKQRIGQGKTSVMEVSENAIYNSIARAIESIVSGDYEVALEFFALYFEETEEGWAIGFKPEGAVLSSYMDNVVVRGTGDQMRSVLLKEVSGNTILYEFEGLDARDLTDEEERLFAL